MVCRAPRPPRTLSATAWSRFSLNHTTPGRKRRPSSSWGRSSSEQRGYLQGVGCRRLVTGGWLQGLVAGGWLQRVIDRG